jgi:hypothetical protein
MRGIECQVDVLEVAGEGETLEHHLQVRLTPDCQTLLSEDMSTLLEFVDAPQGKLELLKLHSVIFTFIGREGERLLDVIQGNALGLYLSIKHYIRPRILLKELWHGGARLILIVTILKNFPGPPVCLHLSIAGQASQSRGRHHSGLVADYGWLPHHIHCSACGAFFLLHFLDFLLQVFFIVLVLDVDQVE